MSTSKHSKAVPHIGSNHSAANVRQPFVPQHGEEWQLKVNQVHALQFDRFLTDEEVGKWVTSNKNAVVKMLPHTHDFDVCNGKHVTRYARFRNTRDFYIFVVDAASDRSNSSRVLLDVLTFKEPAKVVDVWGALRGGQWIVNFNQELVAPLVMHPAVFLACFQEDLRQQPAPEPTKLGAIFAQAVHQRAERNS